jgi:hypothetical protein
MLTVPANWLASVENVATHAQKQNHVLQMLLVL